MVLRIENLTAAVQELARMTAERHRSSHLHEAQALFRSLDGEALRSKIDQVKERVPWLVARPIDEAPGSSFPLPSVPKDHTVIATDGSHMAPDRHSPVRFLVLNMGLVRLRYGKKPHAYLASEGTFRYREEDLHLRGRDGNLYPIEGALLGILMAVEELEALARLARGVMFPAVALRDGSLIFWPLQNEDVGVQDVLLARVQRALRAFHDMGIPIASYISYPGARDIVNSLRVWLCGQCPKLTDLRSCEECSDDAIELCEWLAPIRDRELLTGLLRTGERSAIFESSSALMQRYAADGVDHRIQFFYVHTGREIARVEAPAWVMQDAQARNLVHAVVVDQCRRGGGYPPALQEAHEQAVITTTDRRIVQTMVEQALSRAGIPYIRSMKDWSKRLRGV